MPGKNFNGPSRFYDTVIVGAGPAGASAARELVKKGMRTIIIEKKKLPRYKICSGLIQDDAQDIVFEKFGRLPKSVFSAPGFLKGVRFCAAGCAISDLRLQKPQVMNVWRSQFDHWLIRQSGVELWEGHRLIGLSQNEKTVHAKIMAPNNGVFEIESSYLIGADGGKSSTRALLSPAFEQTVKYSKFVQAYCQGKIDLDPLYFYMFFDPSLSSFYTWLHIKDEFLVLGVGAYKDQSILKCFQDSTDYLAANFGLKIDKIKRRTGCFVSDMPMRGNFYLGEGRILLAGEAAGFMHAFGEGISAALSTGYHAGVAIYQAGHADGQILPLYSDLVKYEQNRTVKSWKLAAELMKRGK